MKGSAVIASLALALSVAAPSLAQTPAQQPKPAQPTPAPKPAQPPATMPAQPAAPAPAVTAPPPQPEVQNEFVKKLTPIIDQLAAEKGLQLVFNAGQSGISWAAPGLDLTSDVIKKLDAGKAPAATPKP